MAEFGPHHPARPLDQQRPGVREGHAAAPSDGVSEHDTLFVSAAASLVPAHVHAFLAREENSLFFLAGRSRGVLSPCVRRCCRAFASASTTAVAAGAAACGAVVAV